MIVTTLPDVGITDGDDWRSPKWDEDVPSRPAWFVSCPEHPALGKDRGGEPWGYEAAGIAQGVCTRHLRTRHGGAR